MTRPKSPEATLTAGVLDRVGETAEHALAERTTAEERLVERAQAGDAGALREIHDTHHGQVRSHLRRLLGPDSEIDDLVQTVFIRAFSSLETFRGGVSLSTWLYRITANSAHNLLRQRYRRSRLKSALHWFNLGRRADLSTAPLGGRQEAENLLEHLHPDLRQVFVLYHYEGRTLHELAAILDAPVSTIGDRLGRARRRLRALVDRT